MLHMHAANGIFVLLQNGTSALDNIMTACRHTLGIDGANTWLPVNEEHVSISMRGDSTY